MKFKLFEKKKYDLLLIFWRNKISTTKMFEVENYVDAFRVKGTIREIESDEDKVLVRCSVTLETIDITQKLKEEFKDLDFLKLGYTIGIQNKKES